MDKTDSDREELKKIAEEDNAFLKKVENELEPFTAILMKMPAESLELKMVREAYVGYLSKHKHYGKISQYLSKDFLKITGTRKDKLQWILWYLGVLEGINHTVVNVLIVILNATKTKNDIATPRNDYWTEQITKARSMDELEGKFIPLGAKLFFLRANGLETVVSAIDTDFRNCVAHFNFDVEDDEIVVGGERIMPLIAENVFKLVRLLSVVSRILDKVARERRSLDIAFSF
jgi:hypothetical protein